MDLPHALDLRELGEDQGERLKHPRIRIFFDPVGTAAHVADRHRHEQLPPSSLLLQRLMGALSQNRQLHLAHGSLHAEQKPIVRQTRIVDAILISDQRADQAAELQQRVPVAPVASQARSLDRDHDANAAFADGCEKLLEAWSGDARARPPEVVVDDADVGPTEAAGALDEPILPATAFDVVDHLIGRRLANIDDRRAGEMVSPDAAHDAPPSRSKPGPGEQLPPSAALPGSRSWPGGVREGLVAGLAAPRTVRVVDGGLDAWSAPSRGDDSPGSEPK